MSDAPLKGWNHVPDVPMQVSPFFQWPPRPMNMLRWLWGSWFFITERLIIVGVACLSYLWFQPPLEEARTLAFGWIGEMYLRNLILMTVVAGGLHLYFYTFTKQGQRLKYDPRPLMKNGRQFTLGGANPGQHVLDVGQRGDRLDGLRGAALPGLWPMAMRRC